nr:PREDICTED: uncharacterized protein LOC107397444 [Tribolium castaneum]|eukprot:XP_015832954.1 PREDICTED: uncharacterized protein LOC107397444 [Tribolium castaneum]
MYVTIATFSVMIIVIGVSVFAFLFSFQGTFENRYIRITTLVFTIATISIHVLYIGQLIEDACFRVYQTLVMVDWYYWNIENRKLYLIAKAIYSMISVMSKLRNVDYSKNV